MSLKVSVNLKRILSSLQLCSPKIQQIFRRFLPWPLKVNELKMLEISQLIQLSAFIDYLLFQSQKPEKNVGWFFWTI